MKCIITIIIASFISACARHIVTDSPEPPRFDVDIGPPCRMAVFADGELQASVVHRMLACIVRIDGKELQP